MNETMHTLTAAIGFRVLCCAECGILFGVELVHLDQRKRDRGNICCPNGHGNRADPDKAGPSAEQRQELVQALHRAEQAEARAEEAAGKLAEATATPAPPSPHVVKEKAPRRKRRRK